MKIDGRICIQIQITETWNHSKSILLVETDTQLPHVMKISKTENSKSFDASVPHKFSRNGKVYNLQKTSNNLNPGTWISLEISFCTYLIHQPPSSKSFAEREHQYEEKCFSIHQPQLGGSLHALLLFHGPPPFGNWSSICLNRKHKTK